MGRHKEHAVFTAIVMLVIGGIAFPLARTAVGAAPSGEPAVAESISPFGLMRNAHGLPTQTVANPI